MNNRGWNDRREWNLRIADILSNRPRLESGKKVLFCGTSCQTESIIKFVGNDLRKNLIAVDFTCHGTHLPEVWEAYLAR